MSDITMCEGGKCTIKEDCYRYKATPNERQSYFMEPPFIKKMDGTDCEHFDPTYRREDYK